MSPFLRQKLTTILAAVFEVIVIATQEIRRGRLKAYFKKLVGSEGPVQSALERMKTLILAEERLIIAETYGGVSQLNNKTDRVEEMITQVSENLQSLRFDHYGQVDMARREKLKAVLEPSPFPEDFFSAFAKSRVAGTGEWLLQDETLQSWVTGEKQYLWISGSPGTGKSFLTANLISWGVEHLPRIAYFFFRENNPETRSVVQALRDIAYQLSETDVRYAKALMKRSYTADDIRTVSSAYRRLLVEPFQIIESVNSSQSTQADQSAPSVPINMNKTVDLVQSVDTIKPVEPINKIFIFLDGIDEADVDDIEELLFELEPGNETATISDRPFQFALVGRSYLSEKITAALDRDSSGALTTIQITPDRSEEDVAAFISRGVRQSRILNQTTPDFRDKVIDLMQKRVDGLFILAKFMLAEVNRKRHPRSILKSLETYPKEVNGMLEQTIRSVSATISDEEAEDLNEMLRWIACAEEALTLEQLEAALVLHFGDSPFRLEETLRNQYACFFELEREDGLTTDDLIKDFDRKRRELPRDGSPMSRISPEGRASIGGAISERGLSPLRHAVHARNSSISTVSSGGRRGSGTIHSPTRSIDMMASSQDLEYRSKKSTTFVTFFHTTVREYFMDLSITGDERKNTSRIQFDIVNARLHVIKTCLNIFTDLEWFDSYNLGTGRKAMKQYAAWYWQEHLACLDPALVPLEEKKELGMKLYRMLNEDAVILDWTILYKKNNEGLEVLTDRNLKGILRWFSDPGIVDSLSEQAKQFAAGLGSKIWNVCERIGRLYAEAWVSDDYKNYIPTVFCFDVVQSIALMQSGYSSSHARSHWLEIPLDKRIDTAVKWAGFKETGYWNRRVGSTYLSLGKHEKALEYYKKSLEIDGNRQQALGRIAYCLTKDGQYGEALAPALECVSIEEKSLADQKFKDEALGRSRWRLYKDYYLVAQCYYRTFQIDDAFDYYVKAINAAAIVELNPRELFESEIGYLEALSCENKHHDVMKLLQEMALQLTKHTKGQSRLVELLLNQYNKRLILDWIPRAASKTNRTEFLLDTIELAIAAAHDLRDPVVILYLRLAYGTTCAYNYQLDNAIDIFEQISLVEYRARGNFLVRRGHAISFQHLASLYKQQLLHAGLNTPEAAEWLERLEVVQKKQSDHRNIDTPANMKGSDVNTAAIYLGLFYRLQGKVAEAKQMLSGLVQDSMDLLSDTEPLNDEFALDNLLWALLAANDENHATALAHSMRKVDPNASLVSTQSESPVLERVEPKLPTVLSADRNCEQCLNNISSSEEFVICKLCMDCFCMKCLKNVIQQPNNKTSDHQPEIWCRSDHEWLTIPPLPKWLHTGQILYTNGALEEFDDWMQQIKKDWVDGEV